jgi:hypothetical protein
MSARLIGVAAVLIVILAGSMTLPNLVAQDKSQVSKGGQNIQGTVVDISKDKSIITIRGRSSTWLVGFDSNTKFLYGHSRDNKPGSVDQLKESFYIDCVAGVDNKKAFTARACVYREAR